MIALFFLALVIGMVRVALGSATGLSPGFLLELGGTVGVCVAWYFLAARSAR